MHIMIYSWHIQWDKQQLDIISMFYPLVSSHVATSSLFPAWNSWSIFHGSIWLVKMSPKMLGWGQNEQMFHLFFGWIICWIPHSSTGWWFGTWILFFHSVGNFIIPTDELIFFRGVGIPPTSHALTFLESTAAAAELRGRRPGIPDPRMGRGQDGNHHPTGESRGDWKGGCDPFRNGRPSSYVSWFIAVYKVITIV